MDECFGCPEFFHDSLHRRTGTRWAAHDGLLASLVLDLAIGPIGARTTAWLACAATRLAGRKGEQNHRQDKYSAHVDSPPVCAGPPVTRTSSLVCDRRIPFLISDSSTDESDMTSGNDGSDAINGCYIHNRHRRNITRGEPTSLVQRKRSLASKYVRPAVHAASFRLAYVRLSRLPEFPVQQALYPHGEPISPVSHWWAEHREPRAVERHSGCEILEMIENRCPSSCGRCPASRQWRSVRSQPPPSGCIVPSALPANDSSEGSRVQGADAVATGSRFSEPSEGRRRCLLP